MTSKGRCMPRSGSSSSTCTTRLAHARLHLVCREGAAALMALRPRKVHPQLIVTPQDSNDKQRDQFEDLNQWYASLRRPPITWSTHEVATWAWMPGEHGGAGLPWLAGQLHAACIDGHLLLQLSQQQLRHSVLPGRGTEDVNALLQAVAELRRMADGISSGKVLVPLLVDPPQPSPPSTRQILLQGQLPPKRKKKLPWDRDCCDQAQGAAAETDFSAGSTGRGVSQSDGRCVALNAGAAMPTGLGYTVHTTVCSISGEAERALQQQGVKQASACETASSTDAPETACIGTTCSVNMSSTVFVQPGPAGIPASSAACRADTPEKAGGGADVLLKQQPASTATQEQHGSQQQPMRASNSNQSAAPTHAARRQGMVKAMLHYTPQGRRASLSQKEAMLAAAAAVVHAPSQVGGHLQPCMPVPSHPGVSTEDSKRSRDTDTTVNSHATIGSTIGALHNQAGASRATPGALHRLRKPGRASPASDALSKPSTLPPRTAGQAGHLHTATEHGGSSQTTIETDSDTQTTQATEAAHATGMHTAGRVTPGQHRQRLLPAVAAHEQQAPEGPYHRVTQPCPSPDIYGTRDLQRVRQVLAKGRQVQVQHTLKSALSEDLVRAGHKLKPRTAGFQESGQAVRRLGAADHEVALRLASGVPVTRELYLATLETGPLTRQIVQELPSSPRWETQQVAVDCQQPNRPLSAPIAGQSSANAQAAAKLTVAAPLEADAMPTQQPHSQDTLGARAVGRVLDLAVSPCFKASCWPPELAWASEKPAWVQRVVDPEYPLTGYPPTVAGGPMTKDTAQQLARQVHDQADSTPLSPALKARRKHKPQRLSSPHCGCKPPCTCNINPPHSRCRTPCEPKKSRVTRPVWSDHIGHSPIKHASKAEGTQQVSEVLPISAHSQTQTPDHVMIQLVDGLRRGSIRCEDITRVLDAHGSHINDQDQQGMTLLHHVASSRHRHAARLGPSLANTPAEQGPQLGHALRYLLQQGADPNIRDVDLRTPLHLLLDDVVEAATLAAANRIRHLKLATWTLWPPPHMKGLHQSIRLLLAAGSDPLAADCNGVTPIHMAAATGACSLMKLLLQHVAQQDWDHLPSDKQGRTPLQLAQVYDHKQLVALLKGLDEQGTPCATQPHQNQPHPDAADQQEGATHQPGTAVPHCADGSHATPSMPAANISTGSVGQCMDGGIGHGDIAAACGKSKDTQTTQVTPVGLQQQKVAGSTGPASDAAEVPETASSFIQPQFSRSPPLQPGTVLGTLTKGATATSSQQACTTGDGVSLGASTIPLSNMGHSSSIASRGFAASASTQGIKSAAAGMQQMATGSMSKDATGITCAQLRPMLPMDTTGGEAGPSGMAKGGASKAASVNNSGVPRGGRARLAQEQLAQLQQQLPQYVVRSAVDAME